LRIGGADRVDYVSGRRRTTSALEAGQALLTVLASGTARIVDVWRLIVAGRRHHQCDHVGGAGRSDGALFERIFFKIRLP
jgi:hypothetical protein